MGFSVNQRNSLRSPHVRGKDTRRQRDDSVRGITPACAGKSARAPARRSRTADHPRVCGEKSSSSSTFSCILGSPPRVRGKAATGKRLIVCTGITPACAGKSRSRPHAGNGIWDHPRVCGEKVEIMLEQMKMLGSPPRVRGKGDDPPLLPTAGGITPACAGKR